MLSLANTQKENEHYIILTYAIRNNPILFEDMSMYWDKKKNKNIFIGMIFRMGTFSVGRMWNKIGCYLKALPLLLYNSKCYNAIKGLKSQGPRHAKQMLYIFSAFFFN